MISTTTAAVASAATTKSGNDEKGFKMKILMATSLDNRHGMENILDGRNNTFWVSTGLFPQEIIIGLSTSVSLKSITLTTMKVAQISLECSNSNIKEFKPVSTQDIKEGTIQTINFTLTSNVKARYLKFIFRKGYSEFITFHKINVVGQPIIDENEEEKITKTKLKKKDSEESRDKILVKQINDSVTKLKSSASIATTVSNITVKTKDEDRGLSDVPEEKSSKNLNKNSSNLSTSTTSTISATISSTMNKNLNKNSSQTSTDTAKPSRREGRKITHLGNSESHKSRSKGSLSNKENK